MFGARAIKRRRDKEAELKVLTPNTNSQICKYKYTNKQIQIHKHTKMQKLIHRYTNVQMKIQTRTLNSRCSNQIQIHKKANINTIRNHNSSAHFSLKSLIVSNKLHSILKSIAEITH